MTGRLEDLFDPFLADASRTVGIDFSVEVRPEQDGHVFVLVSGPDGTVDGFTFDADAGPQDARDQALDCFDVLQETVHDHLARSRGLFGPWPPCPRPGHTHKLTVGVEPGTREAWWTCRDAGPVVRVGELRPA